MTANRDFTDITRAWLDLMPSEAPDRAVASILQAVDATPQAKPRLAGPWRFSPMFRFALVGAAAIAIVAGALVLYPRLKTDVSSPSESPTISPSPTLGSSGGEIDDALRATWRSFALESPALGNGAGPVSLEFSQAGNGVAASNFGPGYGFASTVTPISADRFELALAQPSLSCAAGDRGTYRWQLSADRSELTLTAEAEACSTRGIVFQRRWVRSLVEATSYGAGIVDSMEPSFRVALPDYSFQTRTLNDFAEIASPDGGGFSLMAFKNPVTFVDPCSADEERNPFTPTAASFFEHFQTTDAFTVGEVTELSIDGHRALHADVTGKENYARCPDHPLYQYTPERCGCHFIVGPGGTDSMYLVEGDGYTFLFIVSPYGSASEQSVIESIQLPYGLPTQ
ncbi:MAG TPA: hypothetical protein VFV72_00865 [Candidatus Limnocylindrales bacterium]|nr:hypothetical protein [Candidatus Limnocylindrales bacterium]